MSKSCEPYKHQLIYIIFTILWIIVIIYFGLYNDPANFVLALPFIIFAINANTIDETEDEDEESVFEVSFVNVGIIFSIAILGLFTNFVADSKISTAILLAVIFVMLSYYPMWFKKEGRHLMKCIRSCLETFAVTLYIYAIVSFLIQTRGVFGNAAEKIKKEM